MKILAMKRSKKSETKKKGLKAKKIKTKQQNDEN